MIQIGLLICKKSLVNLKETKYGSLLPDPRTTP